MWQKKTQEDIEGQVFNKNWKLNLEFWNTKFRIYFFFFFLDWPHLQHLPNYSGFSDNLKVYYNQDALQEFLFAFCPSQTVKARQVKFSYKAW